jgi:hypothetical protein
VSWFTLIQINFSLFQVLARERASVVVTDLQATACQDTLSHLTEKVRLFMIKCGHFHFSLSQYKPERKVRFFMINCGHFNGKNFTDKVRFFMIK